MIKHKRLGLLIGLAVAAFIFVFGAQSYPHTLLKQSQLGLMVVITGNGIRQKKLWRRKVSN